MLRSWLNEQTGGVLEEQAAYTAMAMAGAAMPPKEEIDFVLDRPFLFAITGYDGLPLFMGVVNQPVF